MSFLENTATNAETITPTDDLVLKPTARALYIGVAGNVAITTLAGDDVTFVGVLAGTIIPIQCTVVKSTGTTATDIIALFNTSSPAKSFV